MNHAIRTPPLRILAVDDAPQNLELLMLLLGASGHTIVPAHSGSEAVQLAGEQRFDLVLMDLQMPDMDGLAATRLIRAREAAQGLRRVPVIALSANAQSADRGAGLEAGIGILSTAYVKDPDDPAWNDDAGVKGWREFMTRYLPEADQHDTNYVNAYNNAMALEHVLKACGDDLSTENILKQAYAIKDLELPMLLPGIKINTSPTDHIPVDQMQFMRFNGKTWERFGELQSGD